jgi:hypothetical protein
VMTRCAGKCSIRIWCVWRCVGVGDVGRDGKVVNVGICVEFAFLERRFLGDVLVCAMLRLVQWKFKMQGLGNGTGRRC